MLMKTVSELNPQYKKHSVANAFFYFALDKKLFTAHFVFKVIVKRKKINVPINQPNCLRDRLNFK